MSHLIVPRAVVYVYTVTRSVLMMVSCGCIRHQLLLSMHGSRHRCHKIIARSRARELEFMPGRRLLVIGIVCVCHTRAIPLFSIISCPRLSGMSKWRRHI